MANYDTLVLSGGGFRGVLQIGALHYIEKNCPEILKDVKIFSGCSIGSMIAYLQILGLTADEMLTFSGKLDTSKFDLKIDVMNIFKTYGLYNQDVIIPVLTDISLQKLGTIPTLKQLKEITGKTLICSVYNFTDSKLEYLSPENNPELSCIDAILMSSSVPILFPPYSYNGKDYIDSGIIDNYPVECIYQKSKKILGLNTSCGPQQWEVKNILDYVYKLLNIGRVLYTKNQNYDSLDTINLDFKIDLKTNISRTEKADMFIYGYDKAKDYFCEKMKL